jgi:glycyl-tRNA synthetase beta chain
VPELLLELLSEEIPARMQGRATEDLKRLVTDGLKEAGLSFEEARAFVTPRRLALVVDGLPEKQPDIREERRGPRVDAPEKAIEGFLKSVGLTLDQCERRATEKGEFYFAVIEEKGRETKDILPAILFPTIVKFPWPKSMRWALCQGRWVRPIQGILAIFDERSLDFTAAFGALGALQFGVDVWSKDTTAGHRFLAPKPIQVKDFADYKKKLKAAKVILDSAERRAAILAGAERLAKRAKLTLKADQGLLAEVSGLVEWPVVLMGSIDKDFMDLPDEVLTTAMRTHQKYFSLTDNKSRLAPRFIVVANTPGREGGKEVVAGNERVLRARLSDARYFWDQDRKRTLVSRVPGLAELVFHAKLGSVADKAKRMQALAAHVAGYIPGAEAALAERAALLAKADLTTEMVGEFPELQGVMGRYYAVADGETPEVAEAIADHYAPQGPSDPCPTAPLGVAVALADKIDTLVGFWAIDEKPTGSKDPFALRRAALGIIRLIIENKLRLPLLGAFAKVSFQGGVDNIDADLLAFFADRLKVHLREKGVRHDLIDAVFALGGEDDLVRLLGRVEVLGAFLESDDGANLLTAYRRAANIVRIEEKKDDTRYGGAHRAELLEASEEKELAESLEASASGVRHALSGEDFTGAMAALAGLRRPVDDFFDRVTVNTDEANLRENRLRLLGAIGATMNQVADFSRIEGGER